jgi:hypothetical protein
VNFKVTLGAFRQESPTPPFGAVRVLGNHTGTGECPRFFHAQPAGMKMGLVALETQEGLVLFQQVVGNGAVGIVTGETVFLHGGVLEYEGAPFVGMTLETKIVQTLVGPQVPDQGAVMLVTTAALHFSFPHGMVRRVRGFYFDILVTLQAEIRIAFHQALAFVNRVACGTGHFAHRVIA